jgi:hypothetical protein
MTDQQKIARLEALVALLLPIVESHPDNPQVRTLVWPDGIRVTYRGEECIKYNAPIPLPDPWKVRVESGRKFLELATPAPAG